MSFRSAILMALLGASGPAAAATVLVTDLGDGAGNCPSPTACTLRAAIAAAQPNDTIAFDPGFGYPSTLPLLGTELTVDKTLTIAGPGAARLTLLAPPNRRVLLLSAGTLTLQGLRLTGGNVVGSPGNSALAGSGQNGTSGQTAEGGCVRGASATELVLVEMAVANCIARGGNGGNGGSGANAATSAGSGGNGAAGSDARGGAISTTGRLTLMQSSVSNSMAVGGDGGNGGNGGNASSSGEGAGGGGATGGVARGGGIYVGTPGALLLRNSTLAENLAVGGDGGSGGNGGNGAAPGAGAGGNGGNGGAARGGQLHLASSLQLADLEFGTLGPSNSTGGPGGSRGTGGTNGTPGTQGALDGEVQFALTTPRIRSSVLIGAFPAGDCEGLLTASGINLDSDGSCFGLSSSFAAEFQGAAGVEAGRTVLTPRPGSVVVDMASNCLDLAGIAVTVDQSGRERPLDGDADSTAQCDLGAIEFSFLVFRDGFEE